jgi:branched-chain amino acid transport system ATP-binding protein
MMRAEGLSRRFGGLLAVADVSLTLQSGTVHAVIGPNGAGKSTLVNLLGGELRPSDGRVMLNGADVTGWPAWRLARAGVARTFQRSNLLAGTTVLENARLAAQASLVRGLGLLRPIHPMDAPMQAARAALRRVGLVGMEQAPVRTLSHGQLRQLEIAVALAARPTVLLLDEPLAGLGAEEVAPVASLLRELARDHAVLLVEHDMDVVFAVADCVTVMVDGRVLEQGEPAAVRTSPAVRDVYLGHQV